MSAHALYVAAAYAASALGVLGLIFWVVLDARGRRRDLEFLEAAGVRRRSAPRS